MSCRNTTNHEKGTGNGRPEGYRQAEPSRGMEIVLCLERLWRPPSAGVGQCVNRLRSTRGRLKVSDVIRVIAQNRRSLADLCHLAARPHPANSRDDARLEADFPHWNNSEN